MAARKSNKKSSKKPPTLADAQSMVTVIIPTSDPAAPKKYLIHKEFICHYSPFFDAAFNSKFIEGETQTMTLDDVDLVVFDLFAEWIYLQDISKPQDDAVPDILNLAKLWVLAGRFLVPQLQNKVVSHIMHLFNNGGYANSEEFPPWVWELGKDEPLTTMFIDMLVWASYESFFQYFEQYLPAEMGLEVAKILKMNNGIKPEQPYAESYYVKV